MLDEIFVLSLGLVFTLLFFWAFRNLPRECWQVMGCIPTSRMADGRWRGVNLTWYGFFNALAITLAVGVFLILVAASGQSLFLGVLLSAAILAVGMPASSLVAWIVEGKRNTLSVGGALFVGIIFAPWLVMIAARLIEAVLSVRMEVMPLLAAVSVAYAVGEGVGRLACVSFGCCYGKPLVVCSPFVRRLFARHAFVFTGKTKKIAYAHQLDNQEVIPVQALSAVVLSVVGLAGFYIFLQGKIVSALLLTLTTAQCWRFMSEFLRADYRGGGKITAYQWMAAGSLPYIWAVSWFLGAEEFARPALAAGLAGLWDPAVLVFCGALFALTFVYTGKSSVTDCVIEIDVVEDNI